MISTARAEGNHLSDSLSPASWWQHPVECSCQIFSSKLILKIQTDDFPRRIDEHGSRESIHPEPLVNQFVPRVACGLRECNTPVQSSARTLATSRSSSMPSTTNWRPPNR
jgi:hypothetical protein